MPKQRAQKHPLVRDGVSSTHQRRQKNRIPLRRKLEGALCAACTLLISVEALPALNSSGGLLHCDLNQLENQSQCRLCTVLSKLLVRRKRDSWRRQDHLVFRNMCTGSRSEGSGIDMLEGVVADDPPCIRLHLFAKHNDPAAALIPRRPFLRDVQSDSVFSAARRLLETCMGIDGHPECCQSRDDVLPTRVLNLGNLSTESESTVLQVNEMNVRGSYVALSYCWGKPIANAAERPLQLRKDNIGDLKSGISISKVPKTIQDAITVARRLGFPYLWVDSLCIIQDDPEDKRREISNMANIYKNAAVTIAASTSASSSEGFLDTSHMRTDPYLPEMSLMIPMDRGDQGEVFISTEPFQPSHALDKRAWALQEYMLSSRILMFSDYELLWECKKIPLQSVTGNSNGLEYSQPLESLPWTIFNEDAGPGFGDSQLDRLYMWMTIVTQYTERGLSDPDDRLRALQGIQSELEILWQDICFYGHWKTWFIDLLAWYKPQEHSVSGRSLNRAPSWSWASVDGQILFQEPFEIKDAEVLELTMETLVLKGRVLPFENVPTSATDLVLEHPDLSSAFSVAEIEDADLAYILLGMSYINCPRGKGPRCKGIAFMMSHCQGSQWQRIGLAIFNGTSVWEGIPRESISFRLEMQS